MKNRIVFVFMLWTACASLEAAVVRVSDSAGLSQAARNAGPGDLILLEPGNYRPGVSLSNLRGAPGRNLVIGAANPKRPPRFHGGTQALHLSDIAYVVLRDIVVSGATGNGINIDDGGTYNTPSHHVTLRNIRVTDIGAGGNQDGIKLSGLDDFRIENVTIERSSGGGSGIDMVGCHRGVFEGCVFRNIGSNSIQAKGGTSNITLRRCRFINGGQRAVNLGGSTGLEFFRPQPPPPYEAKNLTVEGCIFSGSDAPAAFVGVDGAVFRYNTIYRPRRWVMRILQETTAPGFVPSRNGVFTDNIIVWRSDELVSTVNIGPNTAPQTFRFARNLWYCMDQPSRSAPNLPTREINGHIGANPYLRDPEKGDFRQSPISSIIGKGAYALPPGPTSIRPKDAVQRNRRRN